MTVNDVAKLQGVTPGTVRDWVRSGALRASRLEIRKRNGSTIRIHPDDYDRFVQAKIADRSDVAQAK